LAGAARTGKPPEQVEKLLLPGLRIERRGGPLPGGHAEDIDQQREPLNERLVEENHPPGNLVARRLSRVLVGDAEVAAEELQNRQPRHRFPVGHAVPGSGSFSTCSGGLPVCAAPASRRSSFSSIFIGWTGLAR